MQGLSAIRIKELRHKNSLTQKQLSVQLGVSQQVVSRWERGDLMPSLDAIAKMSEFFGVTMDYISGRSNSPNFMYNLSENEAKLVDHFRAIDDSKKQLLTEFAAFLRTSATMPLGSNANYQKVP